MIGVLASAGGEIDSFQGVQLGSTSTVSPVLRKFDKDALDGIHPAVRAPELDPIRIAAPATGPVD